MAYLLDTNVVSEIQKPRPAAAVLTWWDSVSAAEVFLSVLTIGEIRQGISRLAPRDPSRAARYEQWHDALLATFGDHIAPVDLAVAQLWGQLSAATPTAEVDGLIAATAMANGWTLVTRNVRHMARTGAPILNPFESAPA
jgi:predicted nucleic acid-binding protein